MTDPVTLGAALLLGLVASGHCVLMCGGITAALGVATAKQANGRPVAALLAGYQIGRIASYSLAGLAFGGALGTAIDWLDIDAVRRALRMLAALALLAGALVALGILRDPAAASGDDCGRSLRRSAGGSCRSRHCREHSASAWSGAGCPVASSTRCS